MNACHRSSWFALAITLLFPCCKATDLQQFLERGTDAIRSHTKDEASRLIDRAIPAKAEARTTADNPEPEPDATTSVAPAKVTAPGGPPRRGGTAAPARTQPGLRPGHCR